MGWDFTAKNHHLEEYVLELFPRILIKSKLFDVCRGLYIGSTPRMQSSPTTIITLLRSGITKYKPVFATVIWGLHRPDMYI